jgi:hypothetical protein
MHGIVVPNFTVQQNKIRKVSAFIYNVTLVDLIERFWRGTIESLAGFQCEN